MYAVTVCCDIKSAAVDGNSACGNGIICIGNGFNAVIVGIDIESTPIDGNTFIGSYTVIYRSHVIAAAVESLCGFRSPFNAVFGIAVNIQSTISAECDI